MPVSRETQSAVVPICGCRLGSIIGSLTHSLEHPLIEPKQLKLKVPKLGHGQWRGMVQRQASLG